MDETGRLSYGDVRDWIRRFAGDIAANKELLTELDSAIGDADHGINMDRGMQAVVEKLEQSPQENLGALLKTVGMTLVSTVGGAGGPLYGTFFLQMGAAAGENDQLALQDWARVFESGARGVQARGKAEPGDKTMLDALLPAAEALASAAAAGLPVAAALARAAEAAEQGMKNTIPLVARKGRASYLGERSAGHQDPGATSSWLLVKAAAESLT